MKKLKWLDEQILDYTKKHPKRLKKKKYKIEIETKTKKYGKLIYEFDTIGELCTWLQVDQLPLKFASMVFDKVTKEMGI